MVRRALLRGRGFCAWGRCGGRLGRLCRFGGTFFFSVALELGVGTWRVGGCDIVLGCIIREFRLGWGWSWFVGEALVLALQGCGFKVG